jgi:parallel beta-helix repeat protein
MTPCQPEGPTPNRAARRAAGQRGRKLGALGSGAVLATSATAAVLALGAGPAVGATTLVVDSNGDGGATPANCTTPVAGACTIRDALAAAADGDTITFAPSVTGDIQLNSGELEIDSAVTITGPGAGALAIHADTGSRVFNENNNLSSGDLTISGLTITDGDNGNGGGGMEIDCYGDPVNVVLDSVVITGNSTSSNGGGFYMYACGDLTIRNSTVSYNYAESGGGGVRVENSQNLTIENSTFAHNTSDSDGGALYLTGAEGVVTITNSTFNNNEANDGAGLEIYENQGAQSITIANSTVTGNVGNGDGAGLYFYGSDAAILSSTIVGNSADNNTGGVLVTSADVTVTASLVGGNTDAGGSGTTATDIGTGIREMSLGASKHTGRGGGGGKDSGPVAEAGGVSAQAAGSVTITSNVINGIVDPNLATTDGGGNHLGVAPGVGALASNGGATQTLALLPGSGAIDAAGAAVPSFPGNEFDQRGAGYARLVNGALDAGAFEVQAVALVPRFTG